MILKLLTANTSRFFSNISSYSIKISS